MRDKFQVRFLLDGTECDPPKNWQDTGIRANFNNPESGLLMMQPYMSIEEYTFVNREAQAIMEWVRKKGLFHAMSLRMDIVDSSIGQIVSFEGFLDFTEGYKVVSPVEVVCKFKAHDYLYELYDRAEALSLGYLASLNKGEPGFIDKEHYTEVPVVIRKKFDALETAMAGLAIFMMQKEFRSMLKDKGIKSLKDIKTIIAPPTSKPAEIFEAIGTGIVLLAYTALMIYAVIQCIKVFFENLFPKPVKYKGITLRTALERICDRLGLELDCNIPEIDYFIYLPSKHDSKMRANRKDEGVPGPSDYGYQAIEMIQLVMKLFYAKGFKYSVNGKDKYFIRAQNDPGLRNMSSYILPNVLSESYGLNTEDMKANFLLSFQYDATDEWTMPNARDTPFDSKKANEEKERYEKGVLYEVITEIANTVEPKYKLNKGLEEIDIPLALGTRRGNLSVFEQTAKVLLSTVDLVIDLFGGKTFASKIDEGRGRLLISHNSFNVAKLVVLINGGIPHNHRDILSARALYNKYHSWRSFVTNPKYAQKTIHENVKVPFGFRDFLKVQRMAYFTTDSGKTGRFRSLEWRFNADYALIDYEIHQQYTNNLKEIFIEP